MTRRNMVNLIKALKNEKYSKDSNYTAKLTKVKKRIIEQSGGDRDLVRSIRKIKQQMSQYNDS